MTKNKNHENDEGLTAIFDNALSNYQEIPFIAVDFKASSEKIGKKNHYILHLYGSLINGQKAVVTLIGLQIFFDILILDKESIDDFKDEIHCTAINDYKIENIKVFHSAECKKIKGDDAYKVTNTKKCCRQHLKQCIYVQTSLPVEEYDKLLSEIKEDEIMIKIEEIIINIYKQM
ncbi:16646_t:CDS:2, partial [Funneliformis geosporum]